MSRWGGEPNHNKRKRHQHTNTKQRFYYQNYFNYYTPYTATNQVATSFFTAPHPQAQFDSSKSQNEGSPRILEENWFEG